MRCIRSDKLTPVIRQYVTCTLGEEFLAQQKHDLSWALEQSSNTRPILLLSPPTPEITEAEDNVVQLAHKLGKKIHVLSMGQGQGAKAKAVVAQAAKNGDWVFLQHCHLMRSFRAGLEQIV